MSTERCSAGSTPTRCCVGDPWANITALDVMLHGEPLAPAVINAAAAAGVDPHQLDRHVEGDHGWEPHDVGYDNHVTKAVECVRAGQCVFQEGQPR